MNKVLKFGVYFGVTLSLAGCGASEHFMQDDVYNTRTPMMPPGTDLNDVTDYATFVAKKEQNETSEQTAYVSPRQYNDLFYNSQFVYYGYSPYAPITGISYFGYSNYYRPVYGYFGNGMGYSINPYGYSSAYYSNPYMIGYPQYSYGTPSWYAPVSKPSTSKNLSSSHAGTAAGRMGSTTNNGVVNYQNKMIAKPNTQGYSGVGRNTTVNSSPVVSSSSSSNGRNSSVQPRTTVRPVIAGRPSASGSTTTRTSTNSNVESGNSNTGSGRTFTNSSSTRTSTPSSVRSSGNSSGSGGSSTPSSSGGGARSGGRR